VSEQTVRELRASIREWLSDVDELIIDIGHDKWLDIPVRDFRRMGESEDPVAMVVAWNVLALTRLQIASLPECDEGAAK